jgi:hypothetical protein
MWHGAAPLNLSLSSAIALHDPRSGTMQRKHFLKLMVATAGGVVLAGCGGGDDLTDEALLPAADQAAVAAVPADGLSAEEIAGLLFMREEEKLAYDVYVALFERWGAQVFSQIALSEAEHTEAIRQLLIAHGVDDPAASTPPGVFQNTELQALYDELVAMGAPSLIDALKVGCLIEEKDIQDINDKKAEVLDEPDIVRVYDNLLCGSRNHLRAFNEQVLNQGMTYVPQVLTQVEWDAIAYSAAETCGG